MTRYIIHHGTIAIEYELIRSRRRTLGITVHPDGRVVVRAPARASTAEVDAVVRKKARWIFDKLEKFANLPPPAPEARYVDGETHFFLGRPFVLRLVEENRQGITLDGTQMVMRVRDASDSDRKRVLLTEWYRAQARTHFAERLDACFPAAAAHDIARPQMKIRLMKRRWGSCSPAKGSILLNLRLVQAPPRLIDYVIMHELAHLKVAYHNKAYYALLDELLPDWRERRRELEQFSVK